MTAHGVIIKDGQRREIYSRLYCKRWSCPDCGPRKAWLFQRKIAEKAQEFGLSRFLTLTLGRERQTGKEGVRQIRETWRKFRVYLQRKFGVTVSFINVLEFHKSGVPHLHVLVDRFIKQSWISASWSSLGGGKIVDIRHVADLDKVGWYIGKYLSKDALLRVPKGVRRFSTSRNIKLLEREVEGDWTLLDREVSNYFRWYQHKATEVVKEKTGDIRFFTMVSKVDVLRVMDPRFVDLSTLYHFYEEEDWYKRDLSGVSLPPGFDPDQWQLVGYIEGAQDEAGRRLRQGVEQGAEGGGVLDPGTEEAPPGVRP